MNYGEIVARLSMLEQKVEKLSPSINITDPVAGTGIPGIPGALGIQLVGITNIQRTALGVKLTALPDVKHILVYDKDDQTFYTWSGTEWV